MADQWKNPPSDEDIDEPMEGEDIRGRADEHDDDVISGDRNLDEDDRDLDDEEDEDSTTF
jgi:hypothetical protein